MVSSVHVCSVQLAFYPNSLILCRRVAVVWDYSVLLTVSVCFSIFVAHFAFPHEYVAVHAPSMQGKEVMMTAALER